MKDLIKALQIFLKYGNSPYPTHCEHDVLYICGYSKYQISEEDLKELEELGFHWSDGDDSFYSYQYGSC